MRILLFSLPQRRAAAHAPRAAARLAAALPTRVRKCLTGSHRRLPRMAQGDYIELHQKRQGKRFDHAERERKKEARSGHKQSAIAKKVRGIKAKQLNKKRYAEKAEMKKTIKAHEERLNKHKAAEAPADKDAVPAYLLDREGMSHAKVLSNSIKQKRKEKAGKWAVPIPKARAASLPRRCASRRASSFPPSRPPTGGAGVGGRGLQGDQVGEAEEEAVEAHGQQGDRRSSLPCPPFRPPLLFTFAAGPRGRCPRRRRPHRRHPPPARSPSSASPSRASRQSLSALCGRRRSASKRRT